MATTYLFHVSWDEVNRAAVQAVADRRDWWYCNVMLLSDLPLVSGAAVVVDLDYCFDADGFEGVLVTLPANCRIAVHGFNIAEMEALRWRQRGAQVFRCFHDALAALDSAPVADQIAEAVPPVAAHASPAGLPGKLIEAA